MPNLSYSVADFVPFTVIRSADVNTRFSDIKSRLNWAGGTDATTGLNDDNIQSNAASGGGLTRATKLKLGTADHVVINDGTGAMSSEAALATSRGGLGVSISLSGSDANKVVSVNGTGSAIELRSLTLGDNSVNLLVDKLNKEKQNIMSDPIDNSLGISGRYKTTMQYMSGNLLENYSSGGSTMNIVWGGMPVDTSDKDLDSTTGWSIGGSGAGLTTSATAKVGTASLEFDKNNTDVRAVIFYDYGATTRLNLSNNYRIWFWINLPSTTDLTNVRFELYRTGAADSNFWYLTTNYAGSALATGWNLMFVDIKNTAASATAGSGCAYTDQIRYVDIGVTTGSATTTYSNILIDGIYFGYGDIDALGIKGSEFTVYNNSVKNNLIVDAASTRADGPVTLAATVANSYVAGQSTTGFSTLKRSTLYNESDNIIKFDNTSSLAGTIDTEQELRISTFLRESLGGQYDSFIDLIPNQIYRVTTVGGSTIGVADPGNESADLLNGDSVHIFRPQLIDNKIQYRLLATRSLTANASAGGGTTTLTLTTTSIAVNDIVVKKQLSSAAMSVVSESANESYTALTALSDPNGVQLVDLAPFIPYPESLIMDYKLGGFNNTEAVTNKATKYTALAVTGSPTIANTFLGGQYCATGITTSDYLGFGSIAPQLDGATAKVMVSLWYYPFVYTGALQTLVSTTVGNGGWKITHSASADTINLTTYDGATPTSLTSTAGLLKIDKWNHIQATIFDNRVYLYLNGEFISSHASNVTATTATGFTIGINNSATPADALTQGGLRDLKIWIQGTELTQDEVQAMYTQGIIRNLTQDRLIRYRHNLPSGTGQKVSLKAVLTRSTVNTRPVLVKAGAVKTT